MSTIRNITRIRLMPKSVRITVSRYRGTKKLSMARLTLTDKGAYKYQGKPEFESEALVEARSAVISKGPVNPNLARSEKTFRLMDFDTALCMAYRRVNNIHFG